jgi:hypothetical protein
MFGVAKGVGGCSEGRPLAEIGGRLSQMQKTGAVAIIYAETPARF